MVLGALLLVAATYSTVKTPSGRALWLWPLGLLVFAAGLVGLRRGLARAPPKPVMPLHALRTLVEAEPLGFWVCIRCRVLMPRNPTGECLECGSGVDCLEVATEADRSIALAAIPRE